MHKFRSQVWYDADEPDSSRRYKIAEIRKDNKDGCYSLLASSDGADCEQRTPARLVPLGARRCCPQSSSASAVNMLLSCCAAAGQLLVNQSGPTSDRATIFRNPFRGKW
jgi:hypothetical protein